MKIVIWIVLFLVCFIGVLVGAAALTGKLSKESVMRMVKGEPEPVAAPIEEPDDVGPVAQALKKRDEQLRAREESVAKEEEMIKLQQRDLETLRTETKELLDQLKQTIAERDTAREQRLQSIAKSIEGMKPANAAKTLEEFETEDAADVLRLIKEKTRGKILDAMAPEKAALLLQNLQSREF